MDSGNSVPLALPIDNFSLFFPDNFEDLWQIAGLLRGCLLEL